MGNATQKREICEPKVMKCKVTKSHVHQSTSTFWRDTWWHSSKSQITTSFLNNNKLPEPNNLSAQQATKHSLLAAILCKKSAPGSDMMTGAPPAESLNIPHDYG
jgi:hypothetical protein